MRSRRRSRVDPVGSDVRYDDECFAETAHLVCVLLPYLVLVAVREPRNGPALSLPAEETCWPKS